MRIVDPDPVAIARNLDIERYNETQIIEISLKWHDADTGIRLMNAILDTSREVLPKTLMVGSVSTIDEPQAEYIMGMGGLSHIWLITGVMGFIMGAGMAMLELIMRPTLLNLKNVINGLGTDTEIGYILNANLNEANSYCKWNDFYTVINYCNTMIQNAPMVRERDADFTEEDLNHYLAEAKGIRAFCYFTLARTFKDIPYMETPYVDDTQRFQVEQTSFENVLDTLISDLKTVEDVAVSDYGDTEAYNRGRITQKAIWALVADMSLWRGNYRQCVDYCNKILTTATNPLSLLPADTYFNTVFGPARGNSDESIWELQFDPNTTNGAVSTFYGSSNNLSPLLSSLDFDGQNGEDWWGGLDMRHAQSYVEDGLYMIKKYTSYCYATDFEDVKANDFQYGNNESNWIIYRLADVYLMKAEALAELGDIAGAVDMVSYTYDRAHPDLETGSLKAQYPASTSQSVIRDLVFDERQREFLFEGKRYFDIVRRARREGSVTALVNTYLLRKYVAMSLNQTTVLSKINDIDAIYMPIHQDELRLNSLLEQNAFYKTSEDISKN